MNKKGQSLVVFIILLPIATLAMALIVDIGVAQSAKIRGNSLLREAKKDNLDIDEYFSINDFEITSKKVQSENDCVIIKSRVKSVFGKIIGKNEYEITISDCK